MPPLAVTVVPDTAFTLAAATFAEQLVADVMREAEAVASARTQVTHTIKNE